MRAWYKRIARHAALALVIILGLVLRILPAPISAGSDIAQFAGFADTAARHGACFYHYASGDKWKQEGWPYDWPYVYGPIWAVILGILGIIVPHKPTTFWRNGVYYVYILRGWIIAVKSVLVAADVASALLIYAIVKRRFGWKWGITSTTLYLLSPAVIYESAIYGMFDQLAVALLLASILFLSSRPLASGILAGYSLATKQVVAPPLLGLTIYVLRRRRDVARGFAAGLMLGLTAVLLPFAAMCPSSISIILESMLSASKPGPVEPLSYNFNGFSSLATYIYKQRGVEAALIIIDHWWILAFLLLGVVLYRAYRRPWPVAYSYMLAFYTVFLASYWRINYQYFVTFIALAALAIPYLRSCGKLALTQAYIAANAWVFIYPLSWWFHVHIRSPDKAAWRLVDKITLMVFDDAFYVAYSVGVTFLLLSLLACISKEE